MIFVTVGSATYQFNRIFKILDKMCEDSLLKKEEILAQTGITKYKSRYYKCVDMLEHEEFLKMIDKAEVIICHAGVGTIINALKKGKKVIAFPRLKQYEEHVDNHQEEIAKLFSDNNFIMSANNYEELIECLKNIKLFNPKKFVSNNVKINNFIIEYIREN